MEITAERLFAKIGELTVALELANQRIAELEAAHAAEVTQGEAAAAPADL